MTPEQRRAKYPLSPVIPMDAAEIAAIKTQAQKWLTAPTFTERGLDLHYHLVARLIATIENKGNNE